MDKSRLAHYANGGSSSRPKITAIISSRHYLYLTGLPNSPSVNTGCYYYRQSQSKLSLLSYSWHHLYSFPSRCHLGYCWKSLCLSLEAIRQ